MTVKNKLNGKERDGSVNRVLKFILLLLPIAAAALFIGFKTADAAKEQSNTPSAVVTMLMPGDSGNAACRQVSEALSRLTMERFGFSVSVKQLPREKYDDQLNLLLQGRDAPDVCYFDMSYSLASYVYSDLLYPLSQLLEVSPDLKDCFREHQRAEKSVFRTIYAIPCGSSDVFANGFLARADILEQLGVCAEDISNLEQLHTLLRRVHKAYPQMAAVVSDYGLLDLNFGYDFLGNGLGVLISGKGTEVVNLYATDAYVSFCAAMRQWNREGLIPDGLSLRRESAAAQMSAMDGFGFFCRLNTDTFQMYSRTCAQELVPIVLSEPVHTTDGIRAGWSVSTASREKRKAMQLLELLYTDPQAASILVNGPEEIGGEEPWVYALPAFPSQEQPLMFSWETDETIVELSPACGYAGFSSMEGTQVMQCLSVSAQYDRGLRTGDLEPAQALPRLLRELDSAGINEIMVEKQGHLDDFLAAKAGR